MVLERFLKTHAASFLNIKVVYYDPFNARFEIHGISLRSHLLLQGNGEKSPL
jgi:hypothetical protein